MTRSNSPATVSDHAAFAQWAGMLRMEAEAAQQEDFDPSVIIDSILTADNFDDAVARQTSSILSGKSLVGVVHTVYDFDVRKSDDKYNANERSLGVWFIVNAAYEDGSEFTYGVGAANVLAILWKAKEFGKLPGKFQIVSRDTNNGELLSLMPVKVAVKG